MTYTSEENTLLEYMKDNEELRAYTFNNLTGFKYFEMLKTEGYFLPKWNPSPIESLKDKEYFNIPYWSALTYLEKISLECDKADNRKYAEEIMVIIREVSSPDGDKSKKVDNCRTWRSFVKMFANFPQDIIKISDIRLIAVWLDSKFDVSMIVGEIGNTLLPKMLLMEPINIDNIKEVVNIVINRKEEKRSDMLDFELNEIFKQNSNSLGEKCGEPICRLITKKIEQFINDENDYSSYIWRPAIEDHDQNHRADDYNNIMITALRDILLSYASKQDATSLLKELFSSKKFIIKRIAIYIINQLFDKYNYKSIYKEIVLSCPGEYFVKSQYYHEVYLLLKERTAIILESEKQDLLKTIISIKGDWIEGADKDLQDKTLRKRLLNAIKEGGNKLPENLEADYFKEDAIKGEHPDLLTYTSTMWGDESILSVSELLAQASIENIVIFMNKYNGKDRWGVSAIGQAGNTLKEAVKIKQELFENEIVKLNDLKMCYLFSVVQAFEDLWKDNKNINWLNVLGFIIVKLKTLDTASRDDVTFAQSILNLIISGIDKNERMIPEEQLSLVEDIIKLLLIKITSTAEGRENDALNEAINTPKGRLLECFLKYCLNRYNAYEKEPDKVEERKKELWSWIEVVLENEIKLMESGNYEFSAIIGAYLTNICYMNIDWSEKNIARYLNKKLNHGKNWRCSMQGYSYVGVVYQKIYEMLKSNGDIEAALNTKFETDQVRQKIIDNISVSYLRGQENIENGLFAEIVNKFDPSDLGDIVNLFWAHRDAELTSEHKERILKFWQFCSNKVKGKEEQYKGVLSDMNLLTCFIDKISDREKELLIQSAPYVEYNYHATFFLEYLEKVSTISPEETADVFLNMIENIFISRNSLPDHKCDSIKNILTNIYLKDKAKANRIYDYYAKYFTRFNQNDFLKEVYERNK